MFSHESILNPLPGLQLLPDGGVVVNGRRFESGAFVLSPLPGDWAVHRGTEVGADLTCRCGNGQLMHFSFADGTWMQLAEDSQDSAVTSVKSHVTQEDAPIQIEEVFSRYVTLEPDEVFRGLEFVNQRPDINFLTLGGVIVGGRTYTAFDDLNGVVGVSSITEYYRRGGENCIVVALDKGRATIYAYDSDHGWFELSKVNVDSAKKRDYYGGFRKWYRWRSFMMNVIFLWWYNRDIREYSVKIDSEQIVLIVPDQQRYNSDPDAWIRTLSRYTNAADESRSTRLLTKMWHMGWLRHVFGV